MIQPLAPGQYRDSLTLTDFLLEDDRAWVGQAFTLRVTGWSMFPTLRQGDVLRVLPPGDVEAGDLVLFHLGRTLVCHRAVSALSGDTVRTRGDDVTGEGEVVRRDDLVGKVAEIRRGGASLDPRTPRAATMPARIGRSVRRSADALRERVAEVSSLLLGAFLRRAVVRPVARLVLARSLSFALGVPAPLRLVRAYRFVELGRRPIDPDRARTALRALPSLREAIVLARIGSVTVGTMAVGSGEVQIRRAGAGLGIEETLRAMAKELVMSGAA